jgi:hypothetical protein
MPIYPLAWPLHLPIFIDKGGEKKKRAFGNCDFTTINMICNRSLDAISMNSKITGLIWFTARNC